MCDDGRTDGLAVHRRKSGDGYCHRRLLPVCRRIDSARSMSVRTCQEQTEIRLNGKIIELYGVRFDDT
jgi:hypothetical protein